MLIKQKNKDAQVGEVRNFIKFAWRLKEMDNGDIIWLEYYRSLRRNALSSFYPTREYKWYEIKVERIIK